jgi:hypothetical protein
MSKLVGWLLGIVGTVITGVLIWWLTNSPTSPIVTPAPLPPPIPTPTLGLRRFPLKGMVLGIDLPSFVTNPVRGSITFNRNDEIASTGKLTVRLSIRNETGSQWKESDPELVLELHPGEQLCSIEPAAYNTANFWLGLEAHCASSDACSYNIDNNRLWATIGNVEVVIAPPGGQCPNR